MKMPSDAAFQLLCILTPEVTESFDLCTELQIDEAGLSVLLEEIRATGIRTVTLWSQRIHNGELTKFRRISISRPSWEWAQSLANQWWAFTFDNGPPVQLKQPKMKRLSQRLVLTANQKQAVKECIVKATKAGAETDSALACIIKKELGFELHRVQIGKYRRAAGIDKKSFQKKGWGVVH